ncbi:MAG: hypothetical protein WCR45_10165 [Bacteroidaceae bacterium]
MGTTEFKQRGLKANTETGSFINMMMSRNGSLPEVGKGATELRWTDRSAYEVIEVREDKKRVIVQQYLPKRIDSNGMSECQDYEYKDLHPMKEVIVWKWGSWRWEREYTENGKTTREYSKVNILWGVKDEYFDYSF